MTKTLAIISVFSLTAIGCTSMPASQASLPAGKFVTMKCSDNKAFQVRMSEDARSARVRAHPGSAELERQPDGRYTGDGFVLNLRAEGGAALEHSGKVQGRGCSPSA